MTKLFKINAAVVLLIFLTAFIAACGQNISQPNAAVTQIEGKEALTAEKPGQTKQEILAENVKAQSLSGQQNSAPRIAITEPDSGDVISDNPYTIWWKAEDPNNDKLLITLEYKKEGDWVLIAGNEINDRSFFWDIGALSNGAYELRVTATDGRESSSNTKKLEIKK